MNKWATWLFGVALLAGGIASQAQTTTSNITNTFDTATSTSGWTYWYDAYNGSYNTIILGWDGTMNDGGPAGSGSLWYTNLWGGVAPGTGEQCQIWGTFANEGGSQYDQSVTIDATKYDTVTFDVHVNANAPTNSAGNICQLMVGFWTVNYAVGGTTNVNIPTSATNGWFHVVADINKSDTTIVSNLAAGWALNINCYGGPNTILPGSPNPTYLWIDNIQANRETTVTPPPTMSGTIANAAPGLNLFLNNQYDRTSIEAVQQTGFGWLDNDPGATTYFFTIAGFPNGSTYPNNQAHIFIATPVTGSSPDYGTTNLVWLNIAENTNGTANATFRYKIFEPNSNANMFGTNYTVGPLGSPWAGQLASLNAATAIGTWGMTFSQDTNVTLIGPGGVTTNFTIDPNVAAQFTDPLDIVFGGQPNNAPPATGQAVILTEVGVTNTVNGVLLDDQFLLDGGVLNTAIWLIAAANAADVQVFPNDPGQKIVSWSIPDTSFALETATNLTGPWTLLSGSQAASPVTEFALGGKNNALVPSANLSPNQSFFRLFTAKFTQLQVLMPGETATPGVAPGKTGTPDVQSVGTSFPVTVNAVDANWNPAPYASELDNIHISSSDVSATLPSDAQLINGTGTFMVTFNAAGTWTVTATDTTQPSKTANTGSPTQAQ